jgi:hypothetical protein
MINKRLKCSTTTPIYIYGDKLINMEVVEYIYIYIYSIDSHQCINDDHFNSQVGIYNFYTHKTKDRVTRTSLKTGSELKQKQRQKRYP